MTLAPDHSSLTTGITAIVLAAGRSSRMRGDDKLLRQVHDVPLLRHCVEQVLASDVTDCVVVIAKGMQKHRTALAGLSVSIVEATDADLGMSASLRSGVLALEHKPKVVFIAFADMPDVNKNHFNRLIAEYDKIGGPSIICPAAQNGSRGHPVLFDAAYLQKLTELTGDIGAKPILQSVPEAVHEVQMDDAVILDLDTPEAWAAWHAKQP